MSILSLPFLLLSAGAGVLTWVVPGKARKYAVLIANLVFLALLAARILDVIYVLVLCAWTYGAGVLLGKQKNRAILALSIAVPVLGLCVFKYAGFFAGVSWVMPLGISFYTFKAISYLADVYTEKTSAQDPITMFDYLIFFPVFMAGPINRAEPFVQELNKSWTFDYADQKKGFVQAMLGCFEKLVIADQLAAGVTKFLSPELSGWYTVFGVILYAFQIYTDFDAYSNVAIGVSRLLGFHLERNFHTPYLSASIPEFWRRWHMSLSSWLRDYIYIPLGGSRKGKVRRILNVLITFLVSGLWHGSTLLFVVWGLGHGILNVLETPLQKLLKKGSLKFVKPLFIIVNFILVALLWIFFRSASMDEALGIFARMGQISGLPAISYETAGITLNELNWFWILIVMVIITDLLRYFFDMNELLAKQFIVVRWLVYAALILIAIIFGVYGPGFHPEDFIYVTF